ncbi:MAG: bifunctional farnesyl-diphosphate farnesyltransferase/squalene synthase [Trizodia sp. TS-e1964]|nr:MAG: bifunctional farnesyl-diphosphate farnesyltransferase/squalene synthase [Trizodia sp. TS-e1964]
MVSSANIIYYLLRPQEVRSIIQWKFFHVAVHQRDEDSEPIPRRICFNLLDKTSRSFSAVIQELNPELLVPVTLFYLVLRGLDTIEDDMTISIDQKEPLLRNFHNILEEEGWTFNGSGPNEKDRELLVKFNFVIEEFQKIKSTFQEIIKDITEKMGNGMADYAKDASHEAGINSIQDYDLYCYYVAGLVGEGLTRLFVESKLANPALLQRPSLENSMGLFLQKTNIIRDVREDFNDNRRFWPKEIWSKHVDKLDDLFDKKHTAAALNCSSEMVLNALSHADECLFYLAGIKDQSVFNFAAIPQSMGIATLALVFRNPLVFERNIKITKGQACHIMVQSTQNLQLVCDVFRKYTREIHSKSSPDDPNFLNISIACGKIEQFIESIFPTQDPKLLSSSTSKEAVTPDQARKYRLARESFSPTISAFAATLFVLISIVALVSYFSGVRFDLMAQKALRGKLWPPSINELKKVVYYDEL